MVNAKSASAVWLLTFALEGHAAALVPLTRSFPPPAPGGTIVLPMQNKSALALIGPITTEVVSSIVVRPAVTLQALYIDSPGGDVTAAIRLGQFLRSQKTTVLVAGRCFSACANFVFAAATAKHVLPGSLVAIHGTTYTYYDGGTMHLASTADSAAIARWQDKDRSVEAQLVKLKAMQRDFYREQRLSLAYHDVFVRYEARRATQVAAACPNYLLWALDKPQLERMGIEGLRTVWTPRSADEAKSAAVALGIPASRLYFGSAAKLESACRADETLADKLRNLLDWFGTATGI